MVPNLKRYGLSGENIVGVSLDVPGEKQFSLHRSVVPGLRTIGVIYDPAKSASLVEEADTAAQRLGMELLKVGVSSHKKVPGALRGMLGKIDALWPRRHNPTDGIPPRSQREDRTQERPDLRTRNTQVGEQDL